MNIYSVTSYLVESMGKIRGKKAFQKLIYFSKAMGVPLTESYKMYYYGPYSEQVADELEACVGLGILDKDDESFNFISGEKSKETLEQYSDSINEYKDRLNKVVEYFGGCDPMTLEILATTHFIYNNMKHLYDITDKENIIKEVEQVKYPKFSKDEILSAYKKLESIELLT